MLAVILLAGCGSSRVLEDAAPAATSVAGQDCREPAPLFKDFTARATAVTWNGRKGKVGPFLALTLEFSNVRKWPVTLSNSGNGIVYSVDFALTNAAGKVDAPQKILGDIADKGIHAEIEPGKTKTGRLLFAVPRGRYTLSIARKFNGGPAENEAIFRCTIKG